MKITWLGQAGFLLETDRLKIIIDPYLSESCLKLNPDLYRRMPVDEKYLEIEPDVIIITHDHLDHYDPDTLKNYLNKNGGITVLSPASVFEKIIKFGNKHNYVKFDRHTEWSVGDIRFSAVKAVHSDERAIGVIIETDGKKYYHTGDTLYNTEIFDDISDDIFALFVVVNGRGNNMNQADAERFAARIGAKYVVPMHWGLHDDLYPDSLNVNNIVIPEIYKEIIFDKE